MNTVVKGTLASIVFAATTALPMIAQAKKPESPLTKPIATCLAKVTKNALSGTGFLEKVDEDSENPSDVIHSFTKVSPGKNSTREVNISLNTSYHAFLLVASDDDNGNNASKLTFIGSIEGASAVRSFSVGSDAQDHDVFVHNKSAELSEEILACMSLQAI